MLELKTVFLIFGIVFLMLLLTRKAIRKQTTVQGVAAQSPAPVVRPRLSEEQLRKTWKSLSYLMLLAGAGNLFMAYNSGKGALETQSYILWMDTLSSVVAAGIAVLTWRRPLKSLVIAYLILTILPIMILISTGHSADGIVHLFPLMLVYFAVKPVWDYLE